MIRKRIRRRPAPAAPVEAAPPPARPRKPTRRRTRPLIVPASLPAIERPPPPPTPVVVAAPPPPTQHFTSQINPAYPVHGTPTTQSVRDNFAFAKAEIEALYDQTAGGIPNDAPADGRAYGRQSAAWAQVIAASGDVVDGGNF